MSETGGLSRIVVIEDETDLGDSWRLFLSEEGFAVEHFEDGASARRAFASSPPDAVIIDIGLPDGSGLGLVREAQAVGAVVIVVTGRDDAAFREEALRLGADMFLSKPVRSTELRDALRHLLNRARPQAAPREADLWTIDVRRWRLQAPDGRMLVLGRDEVSILECLQAAGSETVPRAAMILALGEDPLDYDERRLEKRVRQLRARAREAFDEALPLRTVYGVGYSFTAPCRLVDGP